MYRTPLRRAPSPDSPTVKRDIPPPRDRRSWSGGRSPSRRSRSRSPSRRGRSPARRGRTPDRRSRSPARRSRPGGHARSKSRGRRSRSRPRRSRSSSPYCKYRRRSPGEAREQHRSAPGPQDRSSSRGYPSSGDAHAALPPMPKKSILKKRADVEPSSRDQSPQVDNFSGNKAAGESNLSPEGPQQSPLTMALKMGLVGGTAQPEATLLHGGPQSGWTLGTDMGGGEQPNSPSISQYSSAIGNLLFTKSAPSGQSGLFPDEAGGGQDPPKPQDPKQRRATEIEDEERFLYGDEEDKKPELPPAAPAKSSASKQEFEKIHDLLKTIGLDIGVVEIGELAVRTQERLHGKKAAPKAPAPAEQPPSTKPAEPPTKGDKEAEAAEKTPGKPPPKESTPPAPQQSPAPPEKPQLVLRKPLPKEPSPTPKVEVPVQPPTPDPAPPPMSPSQIPVYPQYTHSPMVPGYNMPPPNYGPYPHYISYPTPTWTMYSPMPPAPPGPQMSVPVSAPAPFYNPRSNLRVIKTTDHLPEAKAAEKTEAKPTMTIAALLAKQEAERKNKEAEKQKVVEELESVRREHKIKNECLKALSVKADQLRLQQGIMLRKKRRERDGHKDPLLDELNKVLDSAQKQISSLSEEITTTKQKQRQLVKVAEILGVSPAELAEKSEPKQEERSPGCPAPSGDSDNESRTSSDPLKSANDLKPSSEPVAKTEAKAKSSSPSAADAVSLSATVAKSEDTKCKGAPPSPRPDPKKSPESRSPYLAKSEDISESRDKSRSKSPRPCTPSKTPPKSEEPLPFDLSQVFEYYDSGSHWCQNCNAICMTVPEYLLHLHDKKHNQCVKEVKRPWVKKKVQEPSATKKQKVNIPLKGPEFLIPVNGYYCELCEEVFPDHTAAEEHLRAYAHNEKYKKYIEAHVSYEATRREKKKASLTAAQEASRKQAEQKRKIVEQKHEAYEHSRSKKAKKEEKEEERKAKPKHQPSASPPSSDHRRNKTPEKEPAKNSTFGKFVWRAAENKSPTAVVSSNVDTASNKPKEEEPKAVGLKPKGFAIKLLGKTTPLPGNALSPSHSAPSTTVTCTTATTSSPATASPTTTSAPQPKVRPNLPSLMNMRLAATTQVTMSKPAPLNTFLSIRSPNVSSKPIPVVKNKSTGVFSEDLVSKAFGGEVGILKESAQPESTDKTVTKELEKTTGQSPKVLQTMKGPDSSNVIPSKKEVGEKPEVKSTFTKPYLFPYPPKPSPAPTGAACKTLSGPTQPAQSPGTATVQQTQNTKTPAPNPVSFTISSTTALKAPVGGLTSPSNNGKSETPIQPPNQQTDKAELTQGREESRDKPSEKAAKTPSKLVKKAPQRATASMFFTSPASCQLEHLLVEKTTIKDSDVKKLPETKAVPTPVTSVSTVKPNKPVPIAPVPVQAAKPAFNATTKLNQKFKKAPLSLPSSLFGYVQDLACKDIKITTLESQKIHNKANKPQTLLPSSGQKSPLGSLTKPNPAKPSTMQQEIDSYYKMIASEDDPEDLTTSEDQDLEATPVPTNVTRTQSKIECPVENKVKLDRSPPPEKTAVIPDVSGEDIDDSDMACEVPEAPSSSSSKTSRWNVMQSDYASSQIHGSSNQKPRSLGFGNPSVNKDQSKETQMPTMATPEISMEDLSVCVTCDSD